MQLIRHRFQVLITLVALLAVGVVATGCGSGDDEQAATPTGTTASGNEADRTFLEDMAPHHAGGVELGSIAQERGENEETVQLGQDVEEAQAAEIEQMQAAYTRLFGEELPLEEMPPDPELLALEEADPFDEAFYDALIPHHQEAILMARTELADGQDPELKELAQSIVDTQSTEIEDMNEWREEFYGAESPAGGVPEGNAAMPTPEHPEAGGHSP